MRPSWRALALGAFCSVLPDAEVLAFSLGIPCAHPLGHRGATHSIAFAVFAGWAVFALALRDRQRAALGDRQRAALGAVGNRDVRHLLWLRDEMGDDLLDAVVVTTGPHAYRRPDGVVVVPAALLGP